MTHAEVKKRIEDGDPFTLHVADGRSFEIPHQDYFFAAEIDDCEMEAFG